MAAKTYTTQQGDTFDIVSRAALGSELLAMDVAAANPAHIGVVVFGAGVVLTIPAARATASDALLPPWRRGQ